VIIGRLKGVAASKAPAIALAVTIRAKLAFFESSSIGSLPFRGAFKETTLENMITIQKKIGKKIRSLRVVSQ
jgi:hypothetical protein